MSKERDLLKKVIRNMQYLNYSCNKNLRDEITELLAQHEQTERKPLSDVQIWWANSNPVFEDGVRFAEKHYKIEVAQ